MEDLSKDGETQVSTQAAAVQNSEERLERQAESGREVVDWMVELPESTSPAHAGWIFQTVDAVRPSGRTRKPPQWLDF
jgi:hypothetical protein